MDDLHLGDLSPRFFNCDFALEGKQAETVFDRLNTDKFKFGPLIPNNEEFILKKKNFSTLRSFENFRAILGEKKTSRQSWSE